MKVETDIITSIAASLMEWTVILMIMDVETFKTNVIIFTGNVIMCLIDNFQYQSESVDIDNITTRKKCLNYQNILLLRVSHFSYYDKKRQFH